MFKLTVIYEENSKLVKKSINAKDTEDLDYHIHSMLKLKDVKYIGIMT